MGYVMSGGGGSMVIFMDCLRGSGARGVGIVVSASGSGSPGERRVVGSHRSSVEMGNNCNYTGCSRRSCYEIIADFGRAWCSHCNFVDSCEDVA